MYAHAICQAEILASVYNELASVSARIDEAGKTGGCGAGVQEGGIHDGIRGEVEPQGVLVECRRVEGLGHGSFLLLFGWSCVEC